MKKILTRFAVACLIFSQGMLLAPNASANSTGCYNNWTPGKNCPLAPYNGQYTFVEQYGYYWTDSKYLKWNKSDSDHIKNSGHRYTQDNTDGDKHFSATANYGTNFPSPSFDRDYDWGKGVWNEAEVTSNSSSFPTPEAIYWTQFQWNRSRLGSGHMFFTSQLSSHEWGEWNSKHHDLLFDQWYDNGHLSSMQGLFDGEWARSFEEINPEVLLSRQGSSYQYDIIKTGRDSDIDVDIDLTIATKADLEHYLRENKERVQDVLQVENVKNLPVVVTFKQPLSPERLKELQKEYTVSIQSFEARVEDEKKEKITLGGVPEETGEIDVEKVFGEVLNPQRFSGQQFKLVGVTSIEGSLTKDGLLSLQKNPSIFTIDVLPAWIQLKDASASAIVKENQERFDMNLNDLYWYQEELL